MNIEETGSAISEQNLLFLLKIINSQKQMMKMWESLHLAEPSENLFLKAISSASAYYHSCANQSTISFLESQLINVRSPNNDLLKKVIVQFVNLATIGPKDLLKSKRLMLNGHSILKKSDNKLQAWLEHFQKQLSAEKNSLQKIDSNNPYLVAISRWGLNFDNEQLLNSFRAVGSYLAESRKSEKKSTNQKKSENCESKQKIQEFERLSKDLLALIGEESRSTIDILPKMYGIEPLTINKSQKAAIILTAEQRMASLISWSSDNYGHQSSADEDGQEYLMRELLIKILDAGDLFWIAPWHVVLNNVPSCEKITNLCLNSVSANKKSWKKQDIDGFSNSIMEYKKNVFMLAMMCFTIEEELINDPKSAKHLPEMWKRGFQHYFGDVSINHSDLLQYIQSSPWAFGKIGTYPTVFAYAVSAKKLCQSGEQFNSSTTNRELLQAIERNILESEWLIVIMTKEKHKIYSIFTATKNTIETMKEIDNECASKTKPKVRHKQTRKKKVSN